MSIVRLVFRSVVAMVIVAGITAPLSATTLIRAGLDELVRSNETVVLGEVLDVVSYWNEDGNFILTDVRIATSEVIKGRRQPGEITITVMGGTVGDLTTLIVGGPELIPGNTYMLFLNPEDLPGARRSLTVRDHCQGVFDIVAVNGGLRAISQANQHPLVPDKQGYLDAPGGIEGFPLDAMIQSLREIHLRTIRNSEETEQ